MIPIARVPATTLAATALASSLSAQPEAPSADGPYRLYLAATAAAEASLRLHETAAARRWLDEAPQVHRGWEWRYLSAQADRSSARALAHSRVLDVAWSPDGRQLLAAPLDQTVVRMEAPAGAGR